MQMPDQVEEKTIAADEEASTRVVTKIQRITELAAIPRTWKTWNGNLRLRPVCLAKF